MMTLCEERKRSARFGPLLTTVTGDKSTVENRNKGRYKQKQRNHVVILTTKNV